MATNDKRGGARKGAGRPTGKADTVTINVDVPPEWRPMIKSVAKSRGVKQSDLLRKVLGDLVVTSPLATDVSLQDLTVEQLRDRIFALAGDAKRYGEFVLALNELVKRF